MKDQTRAASPEENLLVFGKLVTRLEHERQGRDQQIISAVIAAFSALASLESQLGSTRARLIWCTISKRGRGAPSGARDHRRNALLLDLYDRVAVGKSGEELRRAVSAASGAACLLHPQMFVDEGACAAHLRRLLKKRKQQALQVFAQAAGR